MALYQLYNSPQTSIGCIQESPCLNIYSNSASLDGDDASRQKGVSLLRPKAKVKVMLHSLW